ncbi:MAG: hypothetical protein Q7V05_00490 [Methanoregula sp.]|nr:hypothetical protein [Methanoregula sp.]
MISTSRYCRIRYRATGLLSKQDCEHVHPSDNFLSRYAPLNSIKMLRADETRCFRVRIAIPATSICLSREGICAQAFNPLHQLLTIWQKEHYLRCEVWLFLRTGQMICFRGIKNEIHDVACA